MPRQFLLFVHLDSLSDFQVCGRDMGQKDRLDPDITVTKALLAPCIARRRCLLGEAEGTPLVQRQSRIGQLAGLNDDGCLEGIEKANAGVCTECYTCLIKKTIPPRALINDTWQGTIPECLQIKSAKHPDGLTPTEAAMLSINLCISELTVLPSGMS